MQDLAVVPADQDVAPVVLAIAQDLVRQLLEAPVVEPRIDRYAQRLRQRSQRQVERLLPIEFAAANK